jgi:hypothetical protein
VFKNEDQRDSRDLDGKRGGYVYTARVPLTGVEPGAYVLGVEARSTLDADLAFRRRIRIVVTPAGTSERPR